MIPIRSHRALFGGTFHGLSMAAEKAHVLESELTMPEKLPPIGLGL